MRIILGRNKSQQSNPLLTEGLWPAIKRVARDRGRHWVAVPYVSQGAVRRVPLQPGDVLITRFDDRTIAAGQTDPREILKYLRRGVEVHNCVDLHAKVYVSERRAVVGSANLSSNSEKWLREAGTESFDSAFRSAGRNFIESLRGEVVGIDFAKRKISLYRPPQGVGGAHKADIKGPTLWIVQVGTVEFSGEDKAAASAASENARSRLRDTKRFSLEEIRYSANWRVREGDYVLQYVTDGRKKVLLAPARANTVHRYLRRGRPHLMVVIEERKRLRSRTPAQLRKWLDTRSVKLRLPKAIRNVRGTALRRALFQLWPGVEEVP